MSLYPLDTIKTRLQTAEGFVRAGGFKGIYRGLNVAALGSWPGGALFFCTYDTFKSQLPIVFPFISHDALHMISSSFGELVSFI